MNKKENSKNLVKKMLLSISIMSCFAVSGVENVNAMNDSTMNNVDPVNNTRNSIFGQVSKREPIKEAVAPINSRKIEIFDAPSIQHEFIDKSKENNLIFVTTNKDISVQSSKTILNSFKGKKEDIPLSNVSSDAINDIFPTKKARKLYKKLQQELDKVYVKSSKSDAHSSSDLSSSSSSSESSNSISAHEAERLCSSIIDSVNKGMRGDLFEECSLILEKISSICDYSYTNKSAKRLLLKDVVNAISNKDVDIQYSLTFLYKILITASPDYATADDSIYNAILSVLASHKDEIDDADLFSKIIDIKSTEFFSLVGKLVFEIQFYNKNLYDMEILFSVAELLKLYSPDYYNKEVKTFLSALMD